MKISLILLLTVSMSGYCQDLFLEGDSPFGNQRCNQIILIDSLGKEVDSVQYSPYFIINNGEDSIKLEKLYDIGLIKNIGLDPYRDFSSVIVDSNELKKTRKY